MGLKIRLARAGAKKRPYYHIVVADSRSPRDGRFIEKLGSYNPMLPAEHADRVRLQAERIQHWMSRARWRPTASRKFLGQAGLAPMPAWREQPVKSAPKKKAQERAKAAAGRRRREQVPESRILMGVIGRPHGVRGLVRVTSYADDLTAYGAADRRHGRRFVLRWRGDGRCRDRRTGGRRRGEGGRSQRGGDADQHAAVRRSGATAASRRKTNSTWRI